jgi:hypothetical protein
LTEKPNATRAQRITARVSIASFVIVALVVMMFPNTSFGSIFQLQQTESPSESGSPSGTPTPTSTTARPIQFLNPSGHSEVVSTKDDGTNTTYHLVAAVSTTIPSNPLVEFKYQSGDENEVAIGIASRVGTTDTFEFQWNTGTLADGGYTLKAILFNGTVEIGRDEQDVSVNNSDDIDDPQAEAVEITSPSTAAELGWYQPEGATSAHAVIGVTSSAASDFPSGSVGTGTILVFYSKAPISEEPDWIACGDEAREEEGNFVQCVLEEGDTPAAVTAVAAVAEQDLPVPLIDGSGDAHRVFPYVQVPTSVQLNPQNQAGKAPDGCADPTVATVLDQGGKPVTFVNTDIHAKGPSDDTRFDAVNLTETQPPDKAHTEPEEAWDCDAGEAAGEQADHELPPGDSDVKHIETGQVTFQIYSQAGGGQTSFGVFVDEDDDDEWCAQEASALGSIGWTGTASPGPTSSPSESPSEEPSGSPSGSPTGTGTTGLSPLGPQEQVCPRSTVAPTGPPEANRTITLESNKRKVVAFRRVRLTGQINADQASCEDDELVEIRRRIHGTTEFKEFKTTATSDDGAFAVRARVKKSADYQAFTPPAGQCDEAMSSARAVRVRVKVAIKQAGDSTPAAGDRIVIAGTVRPPHDGSKAVLQRKKGKRWVKVAQDRLNKRSQFRFALEADWGRARVFRVVWPKQHADHIKGISRKLRYAAT